MQRSLTIATILYVLPATMASAQPTPPQRTISVSGNAEIRVAPDEVLLTVGVETNAMAIEAARSTNDTRVKAIVQAAREQGVPADRVKSEFLNIDPRYESRQFLGFYARRSLTITLRDIAKFEPLLSAVLSAGANYVHGIDFRTTRLREHRDEARRLALVAAREKAAAMAAAMNATLGDPISIHEGSSGWWSPYASWWGSRGGMMSQNVVQSGGGGGGSSDDALVPGQISVNASVNVTFELGRAK